MKSGTSRSTGRYAFLSSSDAFNTFALSVLLEYMLPFTLRGGIDEEWLGLIRAFSVFHQF